MNHSQSQPPAPSYRMHWCVLLAVLVILGAGLFIKRTITQAGVVEPLAATATDSRADWFLLVRCPELPTESGGAEAGRRRLREWVRAMREAGFNTLAFADVLRALNEGSSLPENAVVLMFDPAYRSTVEQLLPLLEAERVPALWVTRSPGRVRADRRFVTGHVRRTLSEEPLWDFAVVDESGRVILEKASAGSGVDRTYHWQADRGVTGVNEGANLAALHRLHASARWSAREFVDRLLADVPLRERRALSSRQIQDRAWGLVLSRGQEERFDLVAPADRRFASTTWEGSRGVTDLEMDLSIGSWFGEVWLTLRTDGERGDRVRLGLAEDRVRVVQEAAGRLIADQELPWRVDPEAGVRFELVLQGSKLNIDAPTAGARVEVPVLIPGSEDSRLELALYHRLHGVAMARAVELKAGPLERQGAPRNPDGLVAAGGPAEKDVPLGGVR